LLQGYRISVILACPESFFSEGFPTDPRHGEDKSGNDQKTNIQLNILVFPFAGIEFA
jgi:hypothetical protein